MFGKIFSGRALKRQAHDIYTGIVAQARLPEFYQKPYFVEDSVEGRFEMILLHLFLADRFLQKNEQFSTLRRAVRELLVKDIDRSLREMGIGDMSVGKQMKKVGSALIGRLASYDRAVKSEKNNQIRAEIEKMLTRNVNFLEESGANALSFYALNHFNMIEARDFTSWTDKEPLFMMKPDAEAL